MLRPSPRERLVRALRGWFRSEHPRRFTAHYEQVLGTSLEIQLVTLSEDAGPQAERAALDEIDRLASIFSGYTADSEISHWQEAEGVDEAVSSELGEVLAAAEEWRERTGGALSPATEALTRLWADHAERGEPVAPESMAELARQMASPLWTVDRERGTARRLTTLPASLNAIAKGYIIDAACERAAATGGVRETLISIGGDLRHIGTAPVQAGITDPFVGAENAPVIDIIRIQNQGLATSGNYLRGFRIGEKWYSHLIDPRSGWPVERVVSASVVADTATRADVLSTAFSVLTPEESLRLVDSLPGVGCLLIADDGTRVANAFWKSHSVSG